MRQFQRNLTAFTAALLSVGIVAGGAVRAETKDSWNGIYPDINGDAIIDASDSAYILAYASEAGAGEVGSFEEYMEREFGGIGDVNPDLNGDGSIDSSDAAVILVYASENGSGEVKSFAEFMEREFGDGEETTETTEAPTEPPTQSEEDFYREGLVKQGVTDFSDFEWAMTVTDVKTAADYASTWHSWRKTYAKGLIYIAPEFEAAKNYAVVLDTPYICYEAMGLQCDLTFEEGVWQLLGVDDNGYFYWVKSGTLGGAGTN